MTRGVSRRRALVGGAAMAVGAMATPAIAQARTVKIGLLLTYSGPFASTGDLMDKATRLFEKTQTAAFPRNVRLEVIRRDEGGANPDLARRLAQELIVRDRVNILAGVQWSPNAGAIAPLTAESKTPFIISNAAGASLTRLSPYIARVSFTIWQSSLPLGQWAARNGIRRAFTAVTDFSPGHDGEAAFTRGFTGAGGEIVGSVRIPLQNPDFVPFLQRVRDARPEAVYVFNPGGRQATALMKAYKDLGMDAAGIRLLGTGDLVTDEELPNMGDAPVGVVTAHHYSTAAKRPENEEFLRLWAAEYGPDSIPNFMSVGAWDTFAAIAHVLRIAGGQFDGDAAFAALRDWRTASPRGPLQIDPVERDAVQNMYIRRTERVGNRLANVEIDTIPMVKDPWKELNPAR